MICVSIGRGRHKMMMAEHRHLAEQGIELVELRLDYIRRAVNLKRLLRNRHCPVIATCRRKEDGGMWEGTEHERIVLLRTAIVDGADYIDLEEDIAGDIPRFGKTKRIISYHNFRETPDELEKLHARMCKLDPDIVKIATMAHSPDDNRRILHLMKNSTQPTVALCMGEIGMPTRILGGKFGAPFTYATFHHERQLAPGQLSYEQMKEVYNYDAINEQTQIFGVIADPVGHSLSPVIHNAAFRHLGLDMLYLPFRVPRENLDSFLSQCHDLDIRGLSVTIPHKEDVLRSCREVDGAVNGIGAANTLVFENENLVVGYNTDFHAAMQSLEEAAREDASPNPLGERKALILGAGGVAKAIAYGLRRRKAEVVIASRTRFRSETLADQLQCRAIDWDGRYEEEFDIIINGTPVGMHPNVDATPYDGERLSYSVIVFDTVYNPEQTLFIKQARAQGCKVITGVDMFIRQAAMQFKYFTGQEAPEEVMREEFKRAIGAARV